MPTTSKDAPLWTRALVLATNLFLTPWCLGFHLLRIYVIPCVYFSFCYADCLARCFPHWLYTDATFPPTDASLGALETSTEGVEWKRLEASREGEDGAPARMRLFDDDIRAADVCQGALGDCWLLSAIACMTEYGGAISSLFESHKANPRGKYYVRLFDVQAQRWRLLTVDNLFPHRDGRLMFTRPNGDEEWVVLLEKAFAKFCGSFFSGVYLNLDLTRLVRRPHGQDSFRPDRYAAIEGGLVVWAFAAMTGDAVASFVLDPSGATWERLEMRPKPDPSNKRKVGYWTTGEHLVSDAMFKLVKKLKHRGCVLGAGSRGKDTTISTGRGADGGIVPGHAYSILDAKKVGDVALVKLRNPWGTFEWDGAWSDASPLWGDRPDVAKACGHADGGDASDGTFWMAWADFATHFDGIDVCFRSQGLRELRFEVDEDHGACGPFVGGLRGIAKFVCLCQGLFKMWCVRTSSNEAFEDFEKGVLKPSDIQPTA